MESIAVSEFAEVRQSRMPNKIVAAQQQLVLSHRIAPRRGVVTLRSVVTILVTTIFCVPMAVGQQIGLPRPEADQRITIAAAQSSHWKSGSYDVWLLRGGCSISQGSTHTQSREAVLWIEQAPPYDTRPTKVIAYLDGEVLIDYPQNSAANEEGVASFSKQIWERQAVSQQARGRMTDANWFGRFYSHAPLEMRVPRPDPEPRVKPAIYHRAMARFSPPNTGAIQRTQFTEFDDGPALTDPVPKGVRRIRAFPRSDVRVQAQWFPSAGGKEWVAVITGGVTIIVDGMQDGRTIDVSTDRLVVWTAGGQPDFSGQNMQSEETPLEFYMEGNIVFREGNRVIHAERMYYDVTQKVGTIVDVELLTPIKDYPGLVRLKAHVIRQLDADHFVAHEGLVTTSRLGEPRYYFSSNEILFEDVQQPSVNPFTGAPDINPETGEQLIDSEQLATARSNFLYFGGIPVFYWPTIATDLREPTYYVESLTVRNDQIFGNQVDIGFDAYQLLGWKNPPEGTKATVNVDYLSKRGLGGGGEFTYDHTELGGLIPGPKTGLFDIWGIKDTGLDNLGLGRQSLVPESEYRGRVFWNHRHDLPGGYRVMAEVGYISDYNFLEQYYENEWDRNKDQRTGVELKKVLDNMSWSLTADARINDFFTETNWWPRGDHFWLGQSLLGDRLTWYEHSSAGYAKIQTAVPPTDPADAADFGPLAWETDPVTGLRYSSRQGERLVTRQEIDMPMQLGAVKVVPYALGELGHWGEGLAGEPIQRAFYQAGARASIPFWSSNPNIENQLLNVHGLAHKILFTTEASFAEANKDVEEFPLYDHLDDNNVEHFRRRFFFNTFGGVGDSVPARFDERLYAIRYGLQDNVTAPATEVVDDLAAVRVGMQHRWQTKRGRPGERRIVDWIVLDTNATWFPKEDRDNFGEPIGLADYDFRWHLGDRLTFLSSGFFDFFSDGLHMMTAGMQLTRPPRGSLYLGFAKLDGPVSSDVINARFNYWLSPKWASTFRTSVDLSDTGNVGHNFAITRIGESMLIRAGFTVNESKDLFAVNFMIEPRFLPNRSRASTIGVVVPPAGALGLE